MNALPDVAVLVGENAQQELAFTVYKVVSKRIVF